MNDYEAWTRAILCGLSFVFGIALLCCVGKIWGLETFVVQQGVERLELQRRVDRLERDSWVKP